MTTSGAAAPGERPRVGRPARINRQMIAESAHAVGLDGLTLKAVADHLGVSIAALYHHVSGKDDLMRLAAEYSANRAPVPQDRGQHWAVWLYEWAVYNREAFLDEPALLPQYLEGAIAPEAVATNVDAVLALLVREGFTVLDANAAFEVVTACALGTAMHTIRERNATRDGRTLLDGYADVLERTGTALPHLRQLVDEVQRAGRHGFHERISLVLRGIAAERGLEWQPIQALLDEHAPRRGRRGPGRGRASRRG